MARICLALAVFALPSFSSASAQYVPAILACSRDVAEFCNDAKSEENQLAACTKAHFEEFSDRCKSALIKIARIREACQTDIGKQCPGTKLGGGRLLLCVKKHFSELGEPCKEEIGHAAPKRQQVQPR